MQFIHTSNEALLDTDTPVASHTFLALRNTGPYMAGTVLWTQDALYLDHAASIPVNRHKDWYGQDQWDNYTGLHVVSTNDLIPVKPLEEVQEGELIRWIKAPRDVQGAHVRPGDMVRVLERDGDDLYVQGDDRDTAWVNLSDWLTSVVVLDRKFDQAPPTTTQVLDEMVRNGGGEPTVPLSEVESIIRAYVDGLGEYHSYGEALIEVFRERFAPKPKPSTRVRVTLTLDGVDQDEVSVADLARLVYNKGAQLGAGGLVDHIQVVTGR